jgi:uncharacterized membrane protein YeaQ/YmgE (transglycosylase-associated protein family)
MDVTALIILLVIGAIAGWLAGMIMKGGGFGLIGNIVVGVVGAFIGTFVLGWLGIGGMFGNPFVSAIVTALIGAIILLFIIGLVKR